MRKDTTFKSEKLTEEEFSKKYWEPSPNNYFPYQYHTMEISDGRDEKEQLIINNVRALWNLKSFFRDSIDNAIELEKHFIKRKIINTLKKISPLAAILICLVTVIFIEKKR